MLGGPIEFASVTPLVPQAAASALVHDVLSCLHRLQRGNVKAVPTQQGRIWSAAARTGYADSNPRGDPQAHSPASESACIGVSRIRLQGMQPCPWPRFLFPSFD